MPISAIHAADPLVTNPDTVFAYMGESDTSKVLQLTEQELSSRHRAPLHELYGDGMQGELQRRVSILHAFYCVVVT